MKHFSKILIRPIVTEKMTALQETENKYAFEIPSDINKIDVKKVIQITVTNSLIKFIILSITLSIIDNTFYTFFHYRKNKGHYVLMFFL